MLCHIVSCLWVFTSTFSGIDMDDGTKTYPGTWREGDFEDISTGTLYLRSFYFTVQTITTVGYGDTNIMTNLEMIFTTSIMIIGVISFSFASGSLASILQNYDASNAVMKEKIAVLNRLYKEFYLPLDLYSRLKQTIKYDSFNDHTDIYNFVDELPHKLKLEVSLFLHEKTYKKINFMKERSGSFITWICPLLKPMINMSD